jgi:phosphatidylserine/phosphatidylglycerophosphate/cardiolipin synthase-like enzyme
MENILLGQQISSRIVEIIENAEDYCYIVTPYFNPWYDLIKALKLIQKKQISVAFLVRDEKKISKDIINLNSKYDFDVYFIRDLHAKLYLNEKEAVITSMNILEYSKDNNYEIGYLVRGKENCDEIVQNIIIGDMIKEREESRLKGSFGRKVEKDFYCVECRKIIKYSPKMPLCPECYEEWDKNGRRKNSGTYCHECGKKTPTGVNWPLCNECYDKNRKL